MESDLLKETHGRVRILTLNRPDHGNALTNELTVSLAVELAAAEGDPEVMAVILTGTDPVFCSGLDRQQVVTEAYRYSLLVDQDRSPWKVLRAMNTPVIGAVNGPAVTGGLGLALMCSFVVASERASFSETYAQILQTHPMEGLVSLLAQAVGPRRARELSFTGEPMGVLEAHERGLVNHVVRHGDLLAFARGLAEKIASNNARTVALLNDLYRQAELGTLRESLALEEKGYRQRQMDLRRVRERYREEIWAEPIKLN